MLAQLQNLKRHIHTIKGTARSFGFGSISTICHNLEDNLILKNLQENKDMEINQSLRLMDLIKEIIVKFENGEILPESETNQKLLSIGLSEGVPDIKHL